LSDDPGSPGCTSGAAGRRVEPQTCGKNTNVEHSIPNAQRPATARVRAIDLASPEHIRESVTPTGIVYALYIAIREILPDVTLAEVQNALLDDVLRMTAAAMFLLRMEPADVPPAIAVDATSGAAAETPVVAQS
jgi:hypothetical protein